MALVHEGGCLQGLCLAMSSAAKVFGGFQILAADGAMVEGDQLLEVSEMRGKVVL